MISLFSLDRVSKSPAVFDIDKLKWMNQQYIKKLSAEDLAELLKPYLESTDLAGERLLLFAETMSNHICTLEECKDYLPLIQGGIAEITDEALLDILHQETVPLVLKSFYEKLSTAEVFDAAAVKTALKQIRKENKLGGAQVFMPVRIALTGEQHGPDIDKLVALMG